MAKSVNFVPDYNGFKVAIKADNKEFYRRIIFLKGVLLMARFPKPEAEIVALAQSMVSGLTDNAAVYPAPPMFLILSS